MTTLQQVAALELALEALNTAYNNDLSYRKNEYYLPAINAIHLALAEPEQEQEPVAFEMEEEIWWHTSPDINNYIRKYGTRLYTEPPQREWAGLTDDEIQYPYPPAKPSVYATASNTKAVRDGFEMGGYEKEAGYYSKAQLDEFARAIEAKLKEKNHDRA